MGGGKEQILVSWERGSLLIPWGNRRPYSLGQVWVVLFWPLCGTVDNVVPVDVPWEQLDRFYAPRLVTTVCIERYHFWLPIRD